MPPKRLFVAIELPEVLRDELVRLGTNLPGVRWHPPEKLHLTLAFLGDAVPADVETRLYKTLAAVRVPPFFLPVVGTGSFGGTRPRAIWAGTGRGHPHLFALHRAVHDAVLAAGWAPDLKPFVPHVTLAYCGRDTPPDAVRRFLRQHEAFDAGLMRVEGFALYSSHRGLYNKELNVPWPD